MAKNDVHCDYDNSPDYGAPEPSWREEVIVVLVIILVVATIAGAIGALRRLLSYWDLV